VLPTGGAARFRGGLSASDFVRVFSVQALSKRALRRIGPSVVALAEAEGLSAHAASVRARLEAAAHQSRRGALISSSSKFEVRSSKFRVTR
jgi:histidinol dehydrogenase